MKRTIIAALTLSMLASSLALADPPSDRGHGDRDHREWRHEDHDRRDRDGRDHDRGRWHREDHDRGRHRGWRFNDAGYRRPPGYRYRDWRRGERLPSAYRAPEYVVTNPIIYHLAPPPPGYYWVRVDNNAVLAAIATGIVLNVAFHQFH